MLIARIAVIVIVVALAAFIVWDDLRYRAAVRHSERQFWIDQARMLDLHETAGEVTEGDSPGSSRALQPNDLAGSGDPAPSATSHVTSTPEHPDPIPNSDVSRGALAGLHADTFGGLDA